MGVEGVVRGSWWAQQGTAGTMAPMVYGGASEWAE